MRGTVLSTLACLGLLSVAAAPSAAAQDAPPSEAPTVYRVDDPEVARLLREDASAADLPEGVALPERIDYPAAELETAEPVSLPTGPGQSAVTPQSISLPAAEGSLEGMGESFSALLQSGAATYGLPLAVPPGRNGVSPSLALSYASTSGNGPVGIGWSVGAPAIRRQTDRGLPRYVDRAQWHRQEDRFIYGSGSELVPVDSAQAMIVDCGAPSCAPIPAELSGWPQYRARVEGGFMRFFRAPDSRRWVVQSPDGTRFDFGLLGAGEGPSEMVAASAAALTQEASGGEGRIAAWGLTRTTDPNGSVIYYRYLEHGGARYLADIYYASPHGACGALSSAGARMRCDAPLSDYGARVRFVYEARPDVTSSYTTTWRIEVGLRLARVEMTSALGAPGGRSLVRRYHLAYHADRFHSLLASVQLEGRPSSFDAALGVEVGSATIAESALSSAIVGTLLPPITFEYTQQPGSAIPGFGGVSSVVRRATVSPPHSVDEARSDLFDVNSDGLPDLVVTDPARYRTADGQAATGVFFNGFTGASAMPAEAGGTFSGAVPVAVPSGLSGTMTLSNLNIAPMDADGDGRSDLLHMPRTREHGYFAVARNPDDGAVSPAAQAWRWVFVPPELPPGYTDPRIDLGRDRERIQLLDVDNDHLVDVVQTTGTGLRVWQNLGWLPGGDGRFGSATYDEANDAYVLSTAPIEVCLPHSGVPLDFADAEVRVADMNGDGLQDLVKVRRGRVIYWPGRGLEGFGTDGRCEGGFAAGTYVEMGAPPADLAVDGAGMRLADVNGDGITDIVQIRFRDVDVWFNEAGRSWTRRVTVRTDPMVESRVRLVDVDGSGTLDVLVGDAGAWRWIDLMGGTRPRLLSAVTSALGARSELVYGSSADDYLDDLRLAATCPSCESFTWSGADGECDDKLSPYAGTCVERASGSPVISTVVRERRSTDRLALVGGISSETRTLYAYHDAYYEGIEQEHRGFGAADIVEQGDTHHPTSWSRAHFHQGRRPASIASDRLADNPNEALKGSTYLTEAFDEDGAYLSTSHEAFTLRELMVGLDGRSISYAFASQSDELRYEVASFAPGTETIAVPTVSREHVGASGSVVHDGDDAMRTLAVRGAGWAHVRSTVDVVDNLGRALEGTAHGRIRGEHGEPLPDETIASHRQLTNVGGESGWMWRTARAWTSGHGDPTPLGDTTTAYDERGNAVEVVTDVTQPALFAFGGDGEARDYGAPAPEDLVASTAYDAWGQAVAGCGGGDVATTIGCLTYHTLAYDPDHARFPIAEAAATHRDAGSFAMVGTAATWDRGFGALVTAIDPNGAASTVAYDGVGRVTASVPPPARGCPAGRPTVRIQYEEPDPATRPLGRVRTIQELSCTGALGADVIESLAYVDGAGRVRAALSTGDDAASAPWVRSGITTFTARGTTRRAYQPLFYTGSPDDFAAVLAVPPPPFVTAGYDAFGRQINAWDEHGERTRTLHHALSTDVCDPLDDDTSSPHYGTCTTARVDGHGRAIDTVLRNRRPGVPGTEHYRLFAAYRADGSLVRVQRAETTDDAPAALATIVGDHTRERLLTWDSVGRRIAATDPDTDSRDPARTAADRTWRYLYNRVGDLVAVRDPRGCGQNFYYDHAQRLLGEQYVSCAEAQASEEPVDVVPAGAIGLGETAIIEDVDVRHHFDAYAGTWAPSPSALEDFPSDAAGTVGRLVASVDRTTRVVVAYDVRGEATWSATQHALLADEVAVPVTLADGGGAAGAPAVITSDAASSIVGWDEAHTFVTSHGSDHAGRARASVLPREPDWDASGLEPRVMGTLTYNRRGLPSSVSLHLAEGGGAPIVADGELDLGSATVASHPIVTAIEYLRDGLVASTTLADGTHSQQTYDAKRRPTRAWTVRTATASPGPDRPLGAVTSVYDQTFVWDEASNLVAVLDGRNAAEWPAGHRPQSVYALHDALYRVIGVEYEYLQEGGPPTPTDAASDWRAAHAAVRTLDPMRPEAAPMLGTAPADRPVSLTWEHDWLGNVVEQTDDAHQFYERSLGAVINGTDLGGDHRPSALYVAADLDGPSSDRGGWLELDYGEGGNVVAITVHAQCTDASPSTCADPGGTNLATRRATLRASCDCQDEQHTQLRWDELNRLVEARRYDRSGGTGDWTLEAREAHRYDGANARRIHASSNPDSPVRRVTLSVVPGRFELRGLQTTPTEYEPAWTGEVDAQYVIGGARLLRRTDAVGLPELSLRMPVADLLQTTAAVVDLLTGELVEHGTHLPNGARETLRTSGEGPVEPRGFTGKEADVSVGTIYFGERHLAPHLGRWLSPDPLEVHAMAAGEAMNSYHYVRGNLLQARDPLGLTDDQVANDGDPTNPSNYPNSAGGYDSFSSANPTQPDNVLTEVWEDTHGRATATESPRHPWKSGNSDRSAADDYMRSIGAGGAAPWSVEVAGNDLEFFRHTPAALSPIPRTYNVYVEDSVVAFPDQDVTPEQAMSVLQKDPNCCFPFEVVGLLGETSIELGRVYDLRGPRAVGPLFWLKGFDRGNYVRVDSVTPTSFAFRTGPSHFEGANGSIEFRTFRDNDTGEVILRRHGVAPGVHPATFAVLRIGATSWAWPRQGTHLLGELDARYPASHDHGGGGAGGSGGGPRLIILPWMFQL